jgi:NAD(P)H-hydrate repair Nnr-like enzyme with NAD(P)H-hydrate dehydratase domain
MLTQNDTVKLGQVIQRLTAAAEKNPLLLAHFEKAIEHAVGEVATLTSAERNQEINGIIAGMGNGRGATATDEVARLTAQWDKTRLTLSPVQLASLRALEGDSPVRLQMRWNLIEAARARGADPRTVGAIG